MTKKHRLDGMTKKHRLDGMTKKHRLDRKKKKSVVKRANVKSLKGGLIYGSPGTYGVILGDPPLPARDVRQVYSSLGSISSQRNSRTKGLLGSQYPKGANNNDNSYVSKIFFDENNIPLALSAIKYLTKAVSNAGGETIESIFGDYLALPKKWANNEYFANIDRIKYKSSKYQSDEYWTFNKPTSNEKHGPQAELREKFRNAKIQIQYKKADCGDLDGIPVNTPDAFIDFMLGFQNIAAGIDKLHSFGLAHLDVKLGNMLCRIEQGNKYMISDLDTIRPLEYFTTENFEKLYKEENSAAFDFLRFYQNWPYDYFPTCITLLEPVLKLSDGKINNVLAAKLIEDGLKLKWNIKVAIGCQSLFVLIYKIIKKLDPNNHMKKLITNLRNIFWNKYGNMKLNGDFTNEQERESKYMQLNEFNKFISEKLEETKLPPNEIRDILLKYVDIYGASMSIIRKIYHFLSETPAELITPEILDYLGRIIEILNNIMTVRYFNDKLYKLSFSELLGPVIQPGIKRD